MTKYSFELKLKIVQEYLSGQSGAHSLAKKYDVKSAKDVQKWINAYQQLGALGLQRKRQNTAYSTQFKLNAVHLYLTSEKSYQEIANELKLNNPALITRWVQDYRMQGEFAFSKTRGRPRKEPDLSEHKKIKLPKSELNKTEQELARLQNENLNLRMENEYLKGLRRLRLERQARENPDLFTPSDENSSSHSKHS